MSKQLYEEALADAKRLKEVAEDNAKRALVEAVTPRIRDLIEKELLREADASEDDLDEEALGAPGAAAHGGDLMTDDLAGAISPPDEEGKVTLDLDALVSDPAGAHVEPPMFGSRGPAEFELNRESIRALKPIFETTSHAFERQLNKLGAQVKQVKSASRLVRESAGFADKIGQMITQVEDMYAHVQESKFDSRSKATYENKLENYFKELTKLQEHKMSKKFRNRLHEGDVTLKLTGLPDDLDLDSVGVDLITGEDEGEGGEEEGEEGEGDLELDLDDEGEGEDEGGEGEEEGGDEELDLDLGGDEGEEGEEEEKMESRRLGNNTVVEISENMLRREISRMRMLREADETKPYKGPGPDHFDHFGGGHDEGEALDVELTLEGDDDLDEADDVEQAYEAHDKHELDEQDEVDELDEQDDLDEAEDDRTHGGNVASKGMGPGAESNKQKRHTESLKIALNNERRIQAEAKKKAHEAKKKKTEAQKKAQQKMKEAQKAKQAKKQQEAQKKQKEAAACTKQAKKMQEAYQYFAGKFHESVARANTIKSTLNESARKVTTHNGGSTRSAAETANLRNKLAETNLFNAKLVYTNKLLQNESLSKRQKAEIIERLDEANSLREVKLVYESLSKALAGTSRPLSESTERTVLGSSSRATRPASTNLNEGYETDRWARLAGISK